MGDRSYVTWHDGVQRTEVSALAPMPVDMKGGTLDRVTQLGTGDLTNDAWGSPKVSLPHSLFHGLWTFDIPANMWFMYENGTQVYTSASAVISEGSAAKISTTSVITSCVMESRECPRYQPNRGHLFSTALWCPDKTADGTRTWGLSTDENGIEFELRSDGNLYAVQTSNSSTTYSSVIDTSGVAGFNVEKGNVYDIQYQWRGVGNYYFFVNLQLVHVITHLGTLTRLSMENPALPIHFHCKRATEDVTMSIGCADVTSENGRQNDIEQYKSAGIQTVSIGATGDPVLSIHNPPLINTQTNTRTLTLARITVNCSKKATFQVWLTRDPTALTGATFQPLGAGSFVETDSPDMHASAVTATAYDDSKMNFITTIHVEALSEKSIDNPYRGRIEFPLVRGDYLVVTGTASSADADCVVEWGEQV